MIELVITGVTFIFFAWYVHDKFIQRKSALLINYPVIGRMRYLFEALREPLRQYFGEETYYDSRDKIDWVYKAAHNSPNFVSFSPTKPFQSDGYTIKHSSFVLNTSEVEENMQVQFGANLNKSFTSSSIIGRSAMSDGALSPEATRAFSIAAHNAKFPINTGEGGLTSNYFVSHSIPKECFEYLDIKEGTIFQKSLFKIIRSLFNQAIAGKIYKNLIIKKQQDTYMLDRDKIAFFRPNWDAPIEHFPKEAPKDMPDLILQIGSGLYGVRDHEGNFNPDRYEKVMRFCSMTEIKLAQGAKQTGGKIVGKKVTEDIAYYRGVEAGKDLISPNRFPYAENYDTLFDFIQQLQDISQKPVGIKIVLSCKKSTEELIAYIAKRKQEGKAIVSFISVDSGDGGSATAPLEMINSVGLNLEESLFLLNNILEQYKLKDDIKIIAAGKILTPDDIIVALAMGADFVNIARGFMMSAGCIRARVCAGTGKHVCPVGIATQDKKKREAYLVMKKAKHIAYYHQNVLSGLRNLLAVMGLSSISKVTIHHLNYKTPQGKIYFNLKNYFNNLFIDNKDE